MSKDKNDDIHGLRQDYRRGALRRADLHPDPLVQFARWFEEARNAGVPEPNAMTLSTVDDTGLPSARTVLLKGLERGGFEFFTNYGSRKARDLDANPAAALTFLWKELERQINIRGSVTKLPRETSEAYFASRPQESQLGAWASQQSQPLRNREQLEQQFAEAAESFAEGDVPMPDSWGGFLLIPTVVEFWQGGAGRLHDRFEFHRETPDVDWTISRLSP